MRPTFARTLLELAEEDQRIFLVIGDVGFGVVEPFAARYPDRFLNVGVAESNLAGVSAGLALSGLVPFMYSIANFPTLRCIEQIRNDICYNGANVKIVQTMLGSAKLLRETKMHPVELREMVTSPGGTTISAIRELENAGVRAAFLNAISAAAERAHQLAGGHDD